MKLLLFIACIATTCLSARAGDKEDPFIAYFDESRPVMVTIKMSVAKKGGAYQQFAALELRYNKGGGCIYADVTNPDLVPSGDYWVFLGKDLFLENGIVKETNSREKRWVRYDCASKDFLGYIYYVYSRAGIVTGAAGQALNKEAGYELKAKGDSVTIRTKADNPIRAMITSIVMKATKPMAIKEFIYTPADFQRSNPDGLVFKDDYLYSAKDLPGLRDITIPSEAIVVNNPLEGRMKYP